METSDEDAELITRAEFASALKVSRATTYTWEKTDPSFPKPVTISPRVKRFRMAEVREWLANRPVGVN